MLNYQEMLNDEISQIKKKKNTYPFLAENVNQESISTSKINKALFLLKILLISLLLPKDLSQFNMISISQSVGCSIQSNHIT